MVVSLQREPLKEYNLLSTYDIDQSVDIVSKVYCEHQLIPKSARQLNAKLNAVEGTALTFGYLTYGVDAEIVLPPLPPCYHVNITLAGQSRVQRSGKAEVWTNGMESGAILLPEEKARVDWTADTKQFAIKFPQQKLRHHLAMLLQRDVAERIEFDVTLQLASPQGQSLLRSCALLQAEWEANAHLMYSPDARRYIESLIMTNFLLASDHPYRDALHAPLRVSSTAQAQLVHRLRQYIEEHVAYLPTLDDLASYSGVSVRTIQQAFKAELKMTPMTYVRRIRLSRAMEDLQVATERGDTVTDVAMRWGFYNTGRFAQQFFEQFNCLPSDLLQR